MVGQVLKENTAMLNLAERFDFERKYCGDVYELNLRLQS